MNSQQGWSLSVLLLLSMVAVGCGRSKPVPTAQDVPERMLFHYPGATVTKRSELPASDEDYIDTGGSHDPLEVWVEHELPTPVARAEIFEWVFAEAAAIGLEDCEMMEPISMDGLDVVRAKCETEAVTGYTGSAGLHFFNDEATSADGRATSYRAVVVLNS